MQKLGDIKGFCEAKIGIQRPGNTMLYMLALIYKHISC